MVGMNAGGVVILVLDPFISEELPGLTESPNGKAVGICGIPIELL